LDGLYRIGVEHLSSELSTDYPCCEIAVADNMNVLSFGEPAKEVVDEPSAVGKDGG
jgi:predicted transcriptional regulator